MSTDTAKNAFHSHRVEQAKRRLKSKQIRDTRQKLATASGIRPEYQRELLQMYARNEQSAALAAPLLASIVAIGSVYWGYSPWALLWLATIFISEAALLILSRRFLNDPSKNIDVKSWRDTMTIAAAASGLCWGGLTLILPHANTTADIITFATFIVVLCIRTMFASTVLSFIYASTIPLTFALVVRYEAADEPLALLMATLAVGIHAYFMFLTRGLNQNILSMLSLRAEKDELIAGIEQAKAISDEARHHAEQANIAKSQFLATMSHELRTPLNAILGFSEILKEEMFGPHQNATYKEYARDIHQSGEHLLQVINDILDLSRIEANRYELKEEPVQLAATANECLRLLRLRAQSKGLEIKEHIPHDLPKLWAEEKSVRQVILNLLSNAIKFTPQGGTISIDVEVSKNEEQTITISDNGPGIPANEIEKVLSPFGQGSLAQETAEGGTGLGLPIVKRLMDVHNGTFELKSELREGTTVTATFPQKRSMQALPPVQLDGDKTLYAAEHIKDYTKSSAQEDAPSKASRKSTLKAETIDPKAIQKRDAEDRERLKKLAMGTTETGTETRKALEEVPTEFDAQPLAEDLKEIAGKLREADPNTPEYGNQAENDDTDQFVAKTRSAALNS